MVSRSKEATYGRRKQRKALSCTECARRKLRCSKTVPCTACVDRGKADSCRRRLINQLDSSPISASSYDPPQSQNRAPSSVFGNSFDSAQISTPHPDICDQTSGVHISAQDYLAEESAPGPRRSDFGRPIDHIAVDTPVTLEFFTLNRKRVPRQTHIEQHPYGPTEGPSQLVTDPLLTIEQIVVLLDYHEITLTWTHNVVHLPTFRTQCNDFLTFGKVAEVAWTALYYALLSTTLYHASLEVLQQAEVEDNDDIAILAYGKALTALQEADFTANHSLSAVQAICLLIYVGYNIGESDRLCVLLASAIRIAQCLGIHRLGAGSPDQIDGLEHEELVRAIVLREVKKRTWWFLIRQDWLQIPFANTYTVHPSQFNTPMPSNCLDDHAAMIAGGRVCIKDKDVYTHGSYTTTLNHISVLIWKTQDRMCKIGHPHKTRDGLQKLYDVVLQADSELKKLMREMPVFFRFSTVNSGTVPAHVEYQSRVLLLTLAHKFYSIHRHFQVISFRDNWFAYSRISCVSIAVRSLRALFEMPDNQHTYAARNMWTVNTQVVTAAVWIVFELLFSQEGEESTWNSRELRSIVETCSEFLENAQHKSRIARNGNRLLRMLLRVDNNLNASQRTKVDMEEIISCVRRNATQEDSVPREDFTVLDALMTEDWLSAWDTSEHPNDV